MRILAAILALLGPVAVVRAQDDATALRALVAGYEQAIRSGDVPKSGIRASLTADFSAALPGGQLIKGYGDLSKNENALRTMVGRAAVYDTVDVTVEAKSTHVSGDLAAFSGQTENHATAQAGKSRKFTTYWTAIARKEGGAWKLARHQAVMDPANNSWFAEESSGGPGWGVVAVVGVVLGVAGLIVGFVLAKILGGGAKTAAPGAPTPGPRPASGRSWEKGAAPAAEPAVEATAPKSGRAWEKPATPPAEAAPPADTSPTDPPPDAPARPKRAWEK